MGTKYSTQPIAGYNSSPPPDDGTQVASNLVTWAGTKTKLADPIKTQVAAIDAALVLALNTSSRAVTSTDAVLATDHLKTLECSGTFTETLLDAATAGAGFQVFIKNVGTGVITVDRATATNTVDSVSSVVTLFTLESSLFVVNAAANGYLRLVGGSTPDTSPVVHGATDKTKRLRFEVDGLTSGSTSVLTVPDQSFTVGALARSYLAGLTLSTAGTSATMSVAAGLATDITNVVMMTLAASISKTTSAWAVGSGNGGLDTGAIATSTWYHFYEIMRLDTSVVDVLFSLSASAPTMPANYTVKRRIGSGLTNGSGNWTSFIQDGDLFQWLVPINAINTTNPGTAAVTATLTVPSGVNVIWVGSVGLVNTSAAESAMLVTDLATTDTAPSSSLNQLAVGTTAGNQRSSAPINVRTNTSGQIRYRISASDASTTVIASTIGWVDRRGRDA